MTLCKLLLQPNEFEHTDIQMDFANDIQRILHIFHEL